MLAGSNYRIYAFNTYVQFNLEITDFISRILARIKDYSSGSPMLRISQGGSYCPPVIMLKKPVRATSKCSVSGELQPPTCISTPQQSFHDFASLT